MSDAVLKNVHTHIEALRRRGQQVNESEILHVAGLSGHSLAQDEEITTGAAAQHANRGNANVRRTEGEEEGHGGGDDGDADREHKLHGGEVRQMDERTQRVQEVGGYPFSHPTGTVEASRVLPGPADIPPTGRGPATPHGQGSVGHRAGGAMSMDQIVAFTQIGRHER